LIRKNDDYVKDWNNPESEEPQPRSSLQDRLDKIRNVGNDQEGQPDQTTDDHRPPVSQVIQSADCIVIRKPYGCAISRQEFGEINFLLNTWLDEIPGDAPFPIFNNTNLAYGRIYVECTDGTSVNWICSVIPKIVANWAHGGLMVYHKSEFFRLRKVVINIPWEPLCYLGPENVFLRLERANSGLDTKQWHLLKHEDQEPNRRTLVLRIDDASVEYIVNHKILLYYQLGIVYVTLCKSQAGRTENKI
jgi:hypothetical protein